ncbi:Transcriptional regulator, luxRfamily,associated with agmatine catabolism [Enterococcus sp. HSIEG1]|nr:Transcriptional regulator, luxRfamily,associated with agmatine catabolism [Enterococcus sp. HSIEG1]
MIAIFIYNILLIILYSITMTFAIYSYLKEKTNYFFGLVCIWHSLFLTIQLFI